MKVCPVCSLTYQDDTDRCFADDAVLEKARDPRIGTVVAGRYAIDSVLGTGGMATVYLAKNTLVDTRVAIKIMHAHFADDAALRERSLREAKATASIAHPNIVEILDSGLTEDGAVFTVMELLEGKPLRHLLGERRFAVPEVAALALQMCRGLGRAHDLKLVHRDIKPENIFVCDAEDGAPVVKLVDFGLAIGEDDRRLTATGQIVGSPHYMAPERFDATKRVGPASDLYSLGVVLFEMLTGRLPFESNSIAGFILAHLEETPPRVRSLEPGCPPELDSLVDALLLKDPAARPADAHQVERWLVPFVPAPARGVRKMSIRSGEVRIKESERLDQWVERARTYRAMLDRLWPGEAPAALEDLLAELHATVGRLQRLRKLGLASHERLEALEVERKASRERLGHAVDTIARDLSEARATVRSGGGRGAHARERAAAVFHQSLETVRRLHDADPHTPTDAGLAALQEALAAYAEWRLEHAHSGVSDLEFQLDALQRQLADVEARSARDEETLRALLLQNGQERRELELRLIYLAGRLSDQLRPRHGVADLFQRLGAIA